MVSTALPENHRTRNRRRFLLVGVGLIAIGLISWQAYGLFTGSATATHATDLGQMQIAFGGAGANHRIGTASAGLVPGDWVERTIQLNISHNDNDNTMDDILLTASGDNGPPSFVTDATTGLQIWIQVCKTAGVATAWTENSNNPYDYSCSGTASNVLGTGNTGTDYAQSGTSIGTNLDLTDGATNYLMVRIQLPAGALDSYQGQSSTLSLQFVGHQRTGHGQ